jgi:tetratricopeptide (TPR) repeat protein
LDKKLGTYEKLEERYEITKALDPKILRLLLKNWYNKGVALDHVERHEEAIECFDKALEINPKDANVWYNKGVTLENLEKYEEAIKCFSAALEIKPNINNKVLQNLLSLLDKKLGTYEKLEERYEITKALDPKILRLLLKKRFSALENTPLEKIQEIARKSPRNIISRMNLITKLSLLGKHNEAVDSARKLVSEIPKSKFSHLQLGLSYIQNRRMLNPFKRYSLINDAEKEFNNAIEIDPNFALAHLDLALLYSYAGHEGKAKKEFEKAFNLEPQYVQAYRNFLDKSDEKYEGKYDHKDIISKIIQVIKTTGKIAFIGAVGTGLALGGVVSGTTDNITPLGDDLTSIQASSAYILDQETLPISLLDHSLNEGDMIEKSNIKTPFTPPPKNSNGVYLPVSISFKQGKSKQNSEIINESISKAGEQYILNKKQEETFMIQRDTHENENNKEIFDLPLFPPPSSTLEREDKGLKDAFDRLDSAAITAIISYLFYRKNKKDQQKRDDEMDRKIKELKTDRSYLEGKYELAKLYETLARIHQRLGNNRAAMGNIDHATTLYLEISNMDLGLKYRTPEPNKDFAKEVLQEKRIE